MASRSAEISFPDDLLEEIDRLVGERGRSAFLADLAKREVHRLRLIELLNRPDQPGWTLDDHPKLKDGAEAWISKMRDEDERIDSGTEPR